MAIKAVKFWYKYTVLEKITGIRAEKLNAENLCTALEGGRITIDFKRRDGKIADAERLDGKHALVSTRITMGTKEIKRTYLYAIYRIY